MESKNRKYSTDTMSNSADRELHEVVVKKKKGIGFVTSGLLIT